MLVKVAKLTTLGKHLVNLGLRELVQDVQTKQTTHLELVQLCEMLLMMTSPSQLLQDDQDSSSSLLSNESDIKKSRSNRPGRSSKSSMDKRSERKASVRERTVRPPQNRFIHCCAHGDTDVPLKRKTNPFRPPLESEQ